jgi:hypothetical protein
MLKRKSLHELSLQELSDLVEPFARQLQKDNLDKGLYNIYQSPLAKDLLILDYKDRTETVRVDTVTGKGHLISVVYK